MAFEIDAKYHSDRSYYKDASYILVLAKAEFLRDQSQRRRLETTSEGWRASSPQGTTESRRL